MAIASASSFCLKMLVGTMIALMLVAHPFSEAAVTSCQWVQSSVSPCLPFLTAPPKGQPTPQCCTGVRNLNSASSTTADKKMACGCLKAAAHSVKNLNTQSVKVLPQKCNVRLSYVISPTMDCNS